MQLVHHQVISVWAVDKVSEQVAHLVSSHLPPAGMHSIVKAHVVLQFEMCMRGRYEAILSSAPSMRLRTLKGWMPSAPAIQAGVVYVGCIVGASTCGASWPSTSLGHPSGQRAVCIISCGPISDSRIGEA